MAGIFIGVESGHMPNLDVDSPLTGPSLKTRPTQPEPGTDVQGSRRHRTSHLGASVTSDNSPEGLVNFSRKRGLQRDDSSLGIVSDAELNGSVTKKIRATKGPAIKDIENAVPSNVYEAEVSPIHRFAGRLSRFKEATMNDRPSEKPPSVFMRAFQRNTQHSAGANVDALMQEYLDVHQSSPFESLKRKAQPANPDQHSDVSSASASASTTRQSAVFRFGRTMASTFNPVNLFHNLSNTWHSTREELEQEQREKQERDDLKALSERRYAELKQAGMLGKAKMFAHQPASINDSHMVAARSSSGSRDAAIHLEGPAAQSTVATVHESGPADIFTADMDAATSPTKRGGRMSSFFRVSSLVDLKRVPSLTNLQRRSSAAFQANSEHTEDSPNRAHSLEKFDVGKQVKLQRRVSSLEAKLEAARRQLQDALEDAPPIPDLPVVLPAPPVKDKKLWSGASKRSGYRQMMITPLPTLPSERLLNPTAEDGQLIFTRDIVVDTTLAERTPAEPSISGHYEFVDSAVNSGEAFGGEGIMRFDCSQAKSETISEARSETSIQSQQSTDEPLAKSAKRTSRKRKSNEFRRTEYRPDHGQLFGDNGHDDNRRKSKRPRERVRDSLRSSPRAQLERHDMEAIASEPSTSKRNSLNKALPPPPPRRSPPDVPVTPYDVGQSILDVSPRRRISLDRITEETASIFSVPLASAPEKPTSAGTTAVQSLAAESGTSPRRSQRHSDTGASSTLHKAKSTGPNDDTGTESTRADQNAVGADPDFEWPEDVF